MPNEQDAFDYRAYLDDAKRKFDERLKQDMCPRDSIENFELVSSIGKGGYGRAYEAERLDSGETVALKLQLKSYLQRKWIIENAIREKQYQWAMRSPFIVPLLAAFRDRTYLYLVMEFAPLGDLKKHIRSDNGLPHETLRLIAGMIVLGVEYLHACNILYRDLKPGNILVFPDGYIKLTDFGISRIHNRYMRGVCGTTRYMAPEMFTGSYCIDGVDWWAFGVTLYEMYSKAWVFGPDPDGPDQRHLIAEARPLFVHDTVPDIVCALVANLVEKEITMRYGSMDNGSDDIKQHAYFEGLDFIDLYQKKIEINMEDFETIAFPAVTPENMPKQDSRKMDYDFNFPLFREF